jgi:hypothetical protein
MPDRPSVCWRKTENKKEKKGKVLRKVRIWKIIICQNSVHTSQKTKRSWITKTKQLTLCCFMWYHTNTDKDYARKVPVFCNVKWCSIHTNHSALWITNAFPDCGPVKCLLAVCLLFYPTFLYRTQCPAPCLVFFTEKVWRIHQYCTWHTKDASTHVYNAPPILVSGYLVQFKHELLLVTRYANHVKHKNHGLTKVEKHWYI